MSEIPPRTRDETVVGLILLAGALAFLGLMLWASLAGIGEGVERWLLLGFLNAQTILFALWGIAILHGGHEGRRYR